MKLLKLRTEVLFFPSAELGSVLQLEAAILMSMKNSTKIHPIMPLIPALRPIVEDFVRLEEVAGVASR
ncbi:hypothetical protein D3C75_1002810 [compost metagenome]